MRGGDTSTGRPPTARQLQAEARREQILETALGLFAERGFDGTSTRQIAKEAGIAEGLIFHYFPTKGSLLTAILQDRLEGRRAFRTQLRPLLEDAGGKPAPEVLRGVASGWLATLRRDEETCHRSVRGGPDEPRSEASVAGPDPGRDRATHRLPRSPRRGRRAQEGSAARDGGDDVRLVADHLLPSPPRPARSRVARAERGPCA